MNTSMGQTEMRAVVYHGAGDVRIEERPAPVPDKDNIIVRVHCCTICGTDLKLATVGNPRCHPPRIIGHEMVGSIEHVGEEVKGFSRGERVTMATTIACGECRVCSRGLGNICPEAKPISYDFDGAFAEYLAVPRQALANGNVIKVPDNVPDDEAVLSEPLSCAINAQEIAGFAPGNSVSIIGGGPLGAIHAVLANATGAGKVMVIEREEPRLTMLRQLKDVVVINGTSETVVEAVRGRTDGLGADVVIVCAPNRQAQESAISFARKGGTVSFFASLPKDEAFITLNSRIVHYNELRIVGASDSRPEHVSKAVMLMQEKKIALEKIITHKITLGEFHEGLKLMRDKKSLKVLLHPEDEK